ncbi:hypothetical protein ACFLZN_01255 [Nanoarchaeota archaeon]
MEKKFSMRCNYCNWKFRRAQMPKLCPNCGREGSVSKDAMQGADDLLKEIDEMASTFRK